MGCLAKRYLAAVFYISGLLGFSNQAWAAAFQLWEQSAASIGNYHAGYAVEANDASIAFFNPAGIPYIQHQQLVIGGIAIMPDFKYHGSVNVQAPPYPLVNFNSVTAQGGVFSFVPNLHYVAPINEVVGFGLSVDVPFGLKTDYGRSTPLRYAGTFSSINVIDISPALGFQLTKKASFGFGLDIQRMYVEFDNVATPWAQTPLLDTDSTNKLNDTAYGLHVGGMYQFTPDTRLGLSYHSQVVHHLTGSSKFVGPLPTLLQGGPLETSRTLVNITLPAYTALSAYHLINPKVALMGSVIYTQWNTLQSLTIQDVAGIQDLVLSQNINVSVPEFYRNTWNLSVGGNYYATEDVTLRAGLGYDETPIRNAYRNVQLPDNNRYIIALGAHYQATKTLGMDVGWAHVFINQAAVVNPPPEHVGDQIVTTNGTVDGGADVLGAQLTWDIT